MTTMAWGTVITGELLPGMSPEFPARADRFTQKVP